MNSKKGFTLVELIVVIAILGILVLLGAPKLLDYIEDAKITQIKGDIKAYETHIGAMLAKNPNSTEAWSRVSASELDEVNSGKTIDKRGNVFTTVDLSSKIIPELEGVKSKLPGVFILDSNNEVFYFNKDLTQSQGGDSGVVSNGCPPNEKNPNYIWNPSTISGYTTVEKPNELGYYKYIGSESIVTIPECINGTKLTSYYKMFESTGVSKVISNNMGIENMSYMFEKSTAPTIDLRELNVSSVRRTIGMFMGSTSTSVLMDTWNTISLEEMSFMFYNSSIINLDLKHWNTSNAVSMNSLFAKSKANVIDVSTWNTPNVKDMSNMFSQTSTPTIDVSNFNTSKVENMNNMFSHSKATVLDVSNFNTSAVKNMFSIFYNSNATVLDVSNWNTSNVTDMSHAFKESKVTNLEFRSWNTSKVKSMEDMFNNSQVQSLDLSSFDTSNVTSMADMFSRTKATAINVSSFNTKKVKDMSSMFYKSSAVVIDVRNFSTESVVKMNAYTHAGDDLETNTLLIGSGMFSETEADEIILGPNFKVENITSLSEMFDRSKATRIEGLEYLNPINSIESKFMFKESKLTSIDLSSLDTSKIIATLHMFQGSSINTVYVKTQGDADKLNLSSGNPTGLTFIVK